MLRLHVEQAIMPKTIVILRASDGAMQFRCLIIRCPLQRMVDGGRTRDRVPRYFMSDSAMHSVWRMVFGRRRKFTSIRNESKRFCGIVPHTGGSGSDRRQEIDREVVALWSRRPCEHPFQDAVQDIGVRRAKR